MMSHPLRRGVHPCRAATSLAAALSIMLQGCGSEPPDTGASSAGSEVSRTTGAEPVLPDPGPGTSEAPRVGTLSVQGDPLVAPGEYELPTSCSYSRASGAFSFGMLLEGDASVGRGPAELGVRAGWAPGTSIPLEDGTYRGDFEYEEFAGDDTVPSYLGEAEIALRLVDTSRESFPVVEVRAAGSGEGMSFEVQGVCQAMVTG